MAIQIDEKYLSVEARRALSNAKNKSQLLRDALEFYVSRTGGMSNFNNEIANDVKEIKKMLLGISQNNNMLNQEESSIDVLGVEKKFFVNEDKQKEEIESIEIKTEEIKADEIEVNEIKSKESDEIKSIEKEEMREEVTYKNKYKDKYNTKILDCYDI